jgi:hypothetical protein
MGHGSSIRVTRACTTSLRRRDIMDRGEMATRYAHQMSNILAESRSLSVGGSSRNASAQLYFYESADSTTISYKPDVETEYGTGQITLWKSNNRRDALSATAPVLPDDFPKSRVYMEVSSHTDIGTISDVVSAVNEHPDIKKYLGTIYSLNDRGQYGKLILLPDSVLRCGRVVRKATPLYPYNIYVGRVLPGEFELIGHSLCQMQTVLQHCQTV